MFEKLCRVCASIIRGAEKAKNLYGDGRNKYLRRLQELTGKKLPQIKGMPARICDRCQSELNLATKFLERFARSQDYLADSITKTQKNSQPITEIAQKEVQLVTEDKKNTNLDKSKLRLKKYHFICEQCGNSFNDPSNFRVHLQRHANNRPYECYKCMGKFHRNLELQRHLIKHTGHRPHKCCECGKHFADRSSKLRHEKAHTNKRAYPCLECDKAFVSASGLKNHIVVHTAERPFNCATCNKTFMRNAHLQAHYHSRSHLLNVTKKLSKDISEKGDYATDVNETEETDSQDVDDYDGDIIIGTFNIVEENDLEQNYDVLNVDNKNNVNVNVNDENEIEMKIEYSKSVNKNIFLYDLNDEPQIDMPKQF